ncbi:SDR family oxidoreductase [Conexibacter sp. JD483]|uniref:SDR family oxidoreductase n=1 Tax=unclassified Conexibacter TaxID=2627773 RepID=UPI002720B6B9|nr:MULTISPECIES: SDR family oxidoreductase [unclassified Conexibacter]MDO8183990.1 SDR family oxidoreductase [Conexibacter sp. CPCC 205706]MDO8196982.1 SDR family oxidoreductase [Conexibacter sp. CPCC 205762]MDR9369048.1 SDR family oxidoreductase [Conexibacter sp. JD483]
MTSAAAPLEGRVIALAGAGGSLGPILARALADEGAVLALADRSQEQLDALVEQLDLPAERIDAATPDLLDPAAASAWAAAVQERFGRVDGLVHAVGGWRGGKPIAEAPLDDWAFLEGLLVRTVQHTSRAFHAALSASGRGRFVLVSAKQAVRPTGDNAAYAAAKAASEAWTYALAQDFNAARNGATANVVAINALVTPKMRAESPEKAFLTFTDADEVAAAIAYLLGDAARKVNGQRLALYASA